MTNYERICVDKAFCASAISCAFHSTDYENDDYDPNVMKWLDTEQRELTDEREHKKNTKPDDVSQWPDWKKRAALCNYEFGKEGL